MKLFTISILLSAMAVCPSLSQTGAGKEEFVYKTVDGHQLRANIFLPAEEEKHPVFIFFHGGGFVFGNRDGMQSIVIEKLLENGIAVISADYRLAPETKMDEILRDVSDMLLWVKEHGERQYGLDSQRIAVGGGSAGGYLALTTAFSSSPVVPNAIVSISAPTGFDIFGNDTGDVSILDNYEPIQGRVVSYGESDRFALYDFMQENGVGNYGIFGFDPFREPEKLKRFTIDNNIRPDAPPILLIHARSDTVVPVSHAELFHEFLQEKNSGSELLIFPDGHSSALIRQNPHMADRLAAFVKKHLAAGNAF